MGYVNLLEQKKVFTYEESLIRTGLFLEHQHGRRFIILVSQYNRVRQNAS